MIINHNIAALNTHRQLGAAFNAQSKSMEKLSSGLRINRAGDDAAGLAISEKMRAQVKGLDQASRNAQDGISLIQTAEGALNETHSILQRMRELAVQASNDTSTLDDRREIQKEVNQLIEEIDRIGNNTQFNTQELLDGNFTGKFHIGSNQGQSITLNIADMKTGTIGTKGVATGSNAVADVTDLDLTAATVTIGTTTITLDGEDYSDNLQGLVDKLNQGFKGSEGVTVELDGSTGIKYTGSAAFTVAYAGASAGKLGTAATINAAGISGQTIDNLAVGTPESATTGGLLTQGGADAAITSINNAIERVSGERSKLGAFQNRLEHTINNLGTSSENLTAAESRIRDVDMAKEMMEQTKNSILSQAAQAMLAQANQAPQGVLQLLR